MINSVPLGPENVKAVETYLEKLQGKTLLLTTCSTNGNVRNVAQFARFDKAGVWTSTKGDSLGITLLFWEEKKIDDWTYFLPLDGGSEVRMDYGTFWASWESVVNGEFGFSLLTIAPLCPTGS